MDQTTPEAIAMTMRHDFGLLKGREREAVLDEARSIWRHHVKPLLPAPETVDYLAKTAAAYQAGLRLLAITDGEMILAVDQAHMKALRAERTSRTTWNMAGSPGAPKEDK